MMIDTETSLLKSIEESLWHDSESSYKRQEVIEEARMHAVAGLIGDNQFEYMTSFVQYLYEQDQVMSLLEKAGIPSVIIKGTAAAMYYTEPYKREFGDIDVLTSSEYIDSVCNLLNENGYRHAHGHDDAERTTVFRKNRISLEIHHRFSYPSMDIEKYIADGLERRCSTQIGEHSFPVLPPLANGLVLLVHMSEHMKSGLGLRQVVDWMMYCDKVLDDEFWYSCFRSAAEEAGLSRFAVVITDMCRRYLGLSRDITWCEDADEELVDLLMETIMASGNFGSKLGKGRNGESVTAAFKNEGFFHHLQLAGEHNWKAYHKYPWLKPFCGAYQLCRYGRQSVRRGSGLKEDIARGNQRYELLKRLGITTKKIAL